MEGGEFDYVAELLKRRSGMVIGLDQSYLIDNRLSVLARAEGLGSVSELVHHARITPEGDVHDRVVDAMMINETLFFRDKFPFDYLRDTVLPELATAGSGPITIWCAACSSGQEPYSIAMMLDQQPGLTGNRPVKIMATDISESILQRARAGRFSQFEVQRGMPIRLLMQYFQQDGDYWNISDTIKDRVRFSRHSLLDSAVHIGRCDVVFCRNVLIYFDKTIKSKILDNLSTAIPVGGHLFLGAAEQAHGVGSLFRETEIRRGVLRRSESTAQTQAA